MISDDDLYLLCNYIHVITVTTGFYRETITGICGSQVTRDQIAMRFTTNDLGVVDVRDGRFIVIKVYEQ